MKLEARQAAWTAAHEELVQARLMPAYGWQHLRAAVTSKEASLFDVYADNIDVGCFIIRIEPLTDGTDELVVMHAISAKPSSVPFCVMVDDLVTQLAKKAGVKSIRVHTDRRGLDRIVEKAGYTFIENVFRKTI